jgi:hypothetical protein
LAAWPARAQPDIPAPVPLDEALPPAYDDQLLRLSEIMGALHFLRDLCGHDDAAAQPPQERHELRLTMGLGLGEDPLQNCAGRAEGEAQTVRRLMQRDAIRDQHVRPDALQIIDALSRSKAA